MEIWGGGFVTALRHAYQVADIDNRRRIAAAWPEYGKQYSDMATKLSEVFGAGELADAEETLDLEVRP